MLAVIRCLEAWRHYLEGVKLKFEIWTDNCHSSACTNSQWSAAQGLYQERTSTLLNTTQLQGQVSNAVPELGTVSPPAVPN